MDMIIQRLSGETFRISDYGKLLNFTVDSPQVLTVRETIDGMDGDVELETTYGPRRMVGSFYLFSENNEQYPIARNKLFEIFNSKESFYIIDTREPYKRWFVKVDGGFTPEQILYNRGQFDITFISSSPYAESVGTTLNPAEDEYYRFIEDDTGREIRYTFNGNGAWVLNHSDVSIDPRTAFLVVKYKGVSTNLSILNKTTNETWSYTGTTGVNDELQLMGVRSAKNGGSIFKDTNKKLITLAKGWNELELSGTSGNFTLSLDFRFLYL